MTISRPVLVALTLTIPVLAGCQFSFSAGGPDYEKLETTMADELNTQYESISQQVSGVRCPRPDETPKTGDSITCVADLAGNDVRVEATFTSDDYDVDFATIDTVYDLGDTADGLADDISAEYGFDVSVECGDGIKIVEVGSTFECEAADRSGDTRPVVVTAGGPDENDRWEVIE